MQFWYLQMHPTFDRDEYSPETILALLKRHSIIGVAEEEQWENDERTMRMVTGLFKEEMTIGDIVMVADGKNYIALVRVIGDYFYSFDDNHYDKYFPDEDVWFGLARPIEIISENPSPYIERYNEIHGKDEAFKHCNMRGTISRWHQNKFMEFWYEEVTRCSEESSQFFSALFDEPEELGELRRELEEVPETEVRGVTTKRKFQDKLRRCLLSEKGACEVTGIANKDLLRVSHIKPWSDSDNYERLSKDNVLLLAANYDAAFDKFLISFSPEDGRIRFSSRSNFDELKLLGISSAASIPIPNLRKARFLKLHNNIMERLDELC